MGSHSRPVARSRGSMGAREELHHLVDQLGDETAAEVLAYVRQHLKGEVRASANGAGTSSMSRRHFFAQSPTDLVTLAARQGVKPVDNFDVLLGDFWPEDEPADEFAATI